MTNGVYQKTVQTLEALLSPRVVSRTLQDGLKQVGKDPETVGIDDIEEILKVQVYRQLQVTMPVTKAKETLLELIENLKHTEAPPEPATDDASQRAALGELREALKPFNLYFEWPETQKLRAQVQLIDGELERGHDASRVITQARLGLQALERKLEDHLVMQARELGELDAGLDVVRTLGGPKVRRLEGLVRSIRHAQESRQLASAELERARKLLLDLRKLMESSVVTESSGEFPDAPVVIEPQSLPADVERKLRLLDASQQQHDLAALTAEFTNLLALRPDLEARVEIARTSLETGTLEPSLEALRAEFGAASGALRADLTRELRGIDAQLTRDLENGFPSDSGRELVPYLRVALSVLDSTLPGASDVATIRTLAKLHAVSIREARTQQDAEVRDTSERERARLRRQAEEGRTREAAAFLELEERARDHLALRAPESRVLRERIEACRSALDNGEAFDLAACHAAFDALRSALARRSERLLERVDAALAAFEPLRSLNNEESARVGRILAHLDSQRGSVDRVSPVVREELTLALEEAEGSIVSLQEQYEATRRVARGLVDTSILDDLLGGFDAFDFPSSAAPASPVQAPAQEHAAGHTQGALVWLERLREEPGVAHAGVLDVDGSLLAGSLPAPAEEVIGALLPLERTLQDLGAECGLDGLRLVTIELRSFCVLVGWPSAGLRLLVALDAPARLLPLQEYLRRELPGLRAALGDPPVAR